MGGGVENSKSRWPPMEKVWPKRDPESQILKVDITNMILNCDCDRLG